MRLAYFIPAMSSHLTLGDEWSQETGINTQSEEGYVQDRFRHRFLIGIVCTAGRNQFKKQYLNRRALLVLFDGALAVFGASVTGE